MRERERERTEVEAPWLETINHRPGWDLCWGRWIPILTSWTPFGRVPRGASDFDCLGIKFTQFYLVSRFAFLSTDSNSLFLLFPFCLQQSSFWLPFFCGCRTELHCDPFAEILPNFVEFPILLERFNFTFAILDCEPFAGVASRRYIHFVILTISQHTIY